MALLRPDSLRQRRETKLAMDRRGFKDGQRGAVIYQDYTITGLADNTATAVFTVTVPNAALGGTLGILLSASLGDGDSTESSYWTIAISRVAGAAAKATVSAKSSNANTTGASGNAAGTITVSSISGAVGAINTFTVNVTVARSAGSATNHEATLDTELIANLATAGVTMSK